MKIVQLKKIDEALYELTYLNFWRVKRSVKIFPSIFEFRFSKTGKTLPYSLDLSVKNLAYKMQIGDVKTL